MQQTQPETQVNELLTLGLKAYFAEKAKGHQAMASQILAFSSKMAENMLLLNKEAIQKARQDEDNSNFYFLQEGGELNV